mmetsp:Transcript_283/g.294  ORF Transcript_283/g.294 Transcript_283/m.294 type:complete len:205 (-) Transcript_283:460-1074(-)
MWNCISYELPYKIPSSTDKGLIIQVVRRKSTGVCEYYNRLAPDCMPEIGSDAPDMHIIGTIASGVVKFGDIKQYIHNATAAFDKLIYSGKESISGVLGQTWGIDELQQDSVEAPRNDIDPFSSSPPSYPWKPQPWKWEVAKCPEQRFQDRTEHHQRHPPSWKWSTSTRLIRNGMLSNQLVHQRRFSRTFLTHDEHSPLIPSTFL